MPVIGWCAPPPLEIFASWFLIMMFDCSDNGVNATGSPSVARERLRNACTPTKTSREVNIATRLNMNSAP